MTIQPGYASWLQLSLTPGLRPAMLRGLLQTFGLPDAVLAQSRAELLRHIPADVAAGIESAGVSKAVAQALEWAAQPGHCLITLADETYPKLLLEIADPPPLLYVRGRPDLLNRPSLAIVGSRSATPGGLENAAGFARFLSKAGITIVSGLALGIDASAHRGGLQGAGSTLAVLGTGVDIAYPARNRELAEEIANQGLLLSEFPLGTRPIAANFPRRNRLISGLARGCLVVEAALGSGSLITARAALDQGREVFAIPGSIHSPHSKGCHALIKAGAKLVETAADVLGELPGFLPQGVADEARDRPVKVGTTPLLAQMGYDPVAIDVLCARAGLRADEVASALLQLELDGQVSALPGGLYQRVR